MIVAILTLYSLTTTLINKFNEYRVDYLRDNNPNMDQNGGRGGERPRVDHEGECPICLNDYTDTVELTCNHHF